MKNRIAQFLMSVVLTVGCAAFANAQSQKATIPFDFIVGDQTFKAGEYSVNFGISSTIKNNFLLRSADGKKSVIISQIVSKDNDKALKQSSFVFYVSNDHYYLAEVNTAQKSVEIRNSQLKKMPKTKKYELALAR